MTVADHEAEVLITDRLMAAYPDAVVLGEEAYAADHTLMERYLTAEHAFTVDPVDGTKNFVHGSPDHAVMVAETLGGETVRGWIWQPEHEVAVVAERGGGTWRNGAKITTTPVEAEREPVGVTSVWALKGQSLEGMTPMGLSWVCCGVDYPHFIAGDADYIVYSRSNPWDHAPGTLMVTEAGGAVGHPDGTAYGPRSTRPGLVVAVDHMTWSAVQRRVRDTFADRQGSTGRQ